MVIVDTSRGALIDTVALIAGLKSRHSRGVALDVYEQDGDLFFEDLSSEIIEDDVFQRLLTFPNVLVQDGRIAGLWRASQETWSPDPWLEQQDVWFRLRALCAFRTEHRACVLGANAERVSVLAASQPPAATAIRVQCTADGQQVSLFVVRSGSALAASPVRVGRQRRATALMRAN